MANSFLALPAPAGNGSGVAVDVSTLGATKTVVVEGNGTPYEPYVQIEVSNDNAGLIWTPVYRFQRPGSYTLTNAVRFMRATVQNYNTQVNPGAPTVNVGGEDFGTTFVELVAPAGNGNGASVDVSALPPFKTVQISGTFKGTCVVQMSNDGGTSWSQADGFAWNNGKGGIVSGVLIAQLLRIRRTGIVAREPNPGLPICDIGASSQSGGGGGTIAGSGTTDRVAKFTGPSTIGNSSITDNGTLVSTTLPVSAPQLIATPAISPAALAAGTTDDYNPTGFATASVIRLTPDAAGSTITSFVATTDGDIKFILNIGTAGNLTIPNQASTGTAANKVITAGGQDLVIPPGGGAIMERDGTTGRWRIAAISVDGPLSAANPATVLAPGNTETSIIQLPIPAGVLRVGSSFIIDAYAEQAGADATAPTFRARIGAASLAGTIAASVVGVAVGNTGRFKISALVTIQTIGAGGTAYGGMTQHSPAANTTGLPAAAVAVDTTVANILELTVNPNVADNSFYFTNASISRVKA